jgi:nucleoid DNA-binding protein
MVENYIQSLLFEHDVVTLSGLGSFEIYESPSEWDAATNSILPFARKVKFNDKNKDDNGLLAKAIADGEGISIDEAKQQIALYVHDIKEALKEENEFKFKELGTLYIDFHYELALLPNPDLNFNKDTFGLPKITAEAPLDTNTPATTETESAKPSFDWNTPDEELEKAKEPKKEFSWDDIEDKKEETEPQQPIAEPKKVEEQPVTKSKTDTTAKKKKVEEKEKKRGTPVWVFFVFIPILIIIGIGVYSFFFPKQSREMFGFMTLKSTTKKLEGDSTLVEEDSVDAKTDTEEGIAEVTTEPAPTPEPANNYTSPKKRSSASSSSSSLPDVETMKPNNPKRYLVIVGGSPSLAEAQKLYKKVVSKGHLGAAITEPTPTVNRYRVSVGDYATAAEAQQKQMEVLNEYKDAWVMMY